MSTPGLVILVVGFASLALADDFKTINGKEYLDATVRASMHSFATLLWRLVIRK